jgi:IS605 OrfB family transposase
MTYNHGCDYTFRPDGRASIQTLEGRIVVEVRGWHRHLDELKQARLGEAKIWFCPRRKEYYLLVAYSVTVAASDPAALESVVGVDLGQRYPAVASDTGNRTLFVASGAGRQLLDRYARTRRSLQSKGTRSSVRRLRARRTREERFRADVNHQVANRIVERYPQAVIGMEELTRIRERTEPRSRKTASPKRRKSNRRRSGWSFADLQAKIAYKAQRDGSVAVKVDADYTSQQCPSCGHTSRANRPRKGLLFVCGQCGFRLHADLVGGRNIAMRTMLVRHDWMSTGRLSTGPDVTRSEAKAERLLRYSELRWSAVTSPDYIPVRELVAGR